MDYNDILYITDTTTRYFKDFDRTKDDDKHDSATEREYENYSDEAGALRVHYQGISADKGVDSIALIGKQVGNTIERTNDIDCMSCYENVHTREELLEQEKLWSSIGLGGIGIAFNSVLIIAGILLIVIKPKVKE